MPQSTSKAIADASDRDLVNAARRGDRAGFEQLVRRYQDRLFVSIQNSVQCPILAEDIIQETFLRAFQHLDSFKFQSEFYTWLYRIALNSKHTYFRRTKKTLSLESVAEESVPLRTQVSDSPTLRVERVEQQKQVRDALARIEDHHRLILMLREFDDFDYQTIATVLDIKIGTVRSRLARARARLKCELTTYATDRNVGDCPPVVLHRDESLLSRDRTSKSAPAGLTAS